MDEKLKRVERAAANRLQKEELALLVLRDELLELIDSVRLEQQLSIPDLASKAGMQTYHLNKILAAEVDPTSTVLLKIVSALDKQLILGDL